MTGFCFVNEIHLTQDRDFINGADSSGSDTRTSV
jgi:hypothetical protein